METGEVVEKDKQGKEIVGNGIVEAQHADVADCCGILNLTPLPNWTIIFERKIK